MKIMRISDLGKTGVGWNNTINSIAENSEPVVVTKHDQPLVVIVPFSAVGDPEQRIKPTDSNNASTRCEDCGDVHPRKNMVQVARGYICGSCGDSLLQEAVDRALAESV